jgi:hypothetical protein
LAGEATTAEVEDAAAMGDGDAETPKLVVEDGGPASASLAAAPDASSVTLDTCEM